MSLVPGGVFNCHGSSLVPAAIVSSSHGLGGWYCRPRGSSMRFHDPDRAGRLSCHPRKNAGMTRARSVGLLRRHGALEVAVDGVEEADGREPFLVGPDEERQV